MDAGGNNDERRAGIHLIMRIVARLRSLWNNLVHRTRVEAAMTEELSDYVDLGAGADAPRG